MDREVDEFSSKRNSKYGKCTECNRFNTSEAWCQSCDPKLEIEGWTSGNKNIDQCIKEFQLVAKEYVNVIEWIPYDDLEEFEEFCDDDGGSKALIIACWKKGKRKFMKNMVNGYIKERESKDSKNKVNLKTLPGAETNSSDFIKEFKNLMQSMQSEGSKFRIYGITYDIETKTYMIVWDECAADRIRTNGDCKYCGRFNTSPSWCQTCDPIKIVEDKDENKLSDKWTSGDINIDKWIKEFRLKTTAYEDIIKWVLYNKLENIKLIGEKNSEIVYIATLVDGIRTVQEETEEDGYTVYTRKYIKPFIVNLKKFQMNYLDFLKELKGLMHSTNPNGCKPKIYGITYEPKTNKYIVIWDEFASERDIRNGNCSHCKRHNTSRAWCQTCDPIECQIWTSGTKYIDEYIKELQVETTAYIDVIEWIPFEKLVNMQKIPEKSSETVFSATWKDGIRIVESNDMTYTKSRTSECGVELKTLHRLYVLTELKNLIQLNGNKIYGLTQNMETNEYMVVFDYYYYERNKSYGGCSCCKRYNTSKSWCKSCDSRETVKGWASENEVIYKWISAYQFEVSAYEMVIKWIPFEKLENVLKISEELSGPIFSATWKDGIPIIEDDHGNITRTRTRPCGVILETLDNSQLETFEVFEEHMKSYNNNEKFKIYGITRNAATNSHLIVLDKFYSNRNSSYGSCPDCKKCYNSNVWCLTCDTQKMTQGWASENKDIDDCIKEFQINANKYTDVIEWVSFSKLIIKDVTIEDRSKSKYKAIWSDGIRIIGGDEKKGYEQSRTPLYPVYLLPLPHTDASDFVKEFKIHMKKIQGTQSKTYGITRDTMTKKYMILFDEIGSKRDSKYGICDDCKRHRRSQIWCLSCDPLKEERPDIENDEISSLIVNFQHRAMSYEDVIEWIPFKNLVHIKEIGKGGFGVVSSATWISGIRKLKNNEKSRDFLNKVAIKTLNDLSEFKNHMDCRLEGISLAVYGLTQKTDKYLMVFQYANKGSLHEYLRLNFENLIWKNKLKLLENISYDLASIHETGYIHADFHSGNILLNQHIDEDEDLKSLKCYITDLGLSINKKIHNRSGEIYGVMPYVAPEVLCGKRQQTQAADIYGFGVIMSEISTGQRPFDRYEFNLDLAMSIVSKGLRPEFASGTPDCYINLAKRCMNPEPDKRPTAEDIFKKIYAWRNDLESNNENPIKKEFQESDVVLRKVVIGGLKHPDYMYTGKIISTKQIQHIFENPEIYEEFAKQGSLRKLLDSKYYDLDWRLKVTILYYIADGLNTIHEAKLVHNDFNSGNIVNENMYGSYITSFGSYKPVLRDSSIEGTFGVMPYIDPDVLYGNEYTQKSDIYSFGIIMTEVFTGYPPYHDIPHDENLAIQVCMGLRPKIRCEVPPLLLDLMNKCLDADPQNRPTAK